MQKKPKEHSKVIVDAALIGAAVILAYVMVMIAVTGDTGSLPELIGVAAVIAPAALGFYMWRAKAKDKIEMYRKDPEAFEAAGIGENDEEETGG